LRRSHSKENVDTGRTDDGRFAIPLAVN